MGRLTDKRQALPKFTVLDFGADDSRGYSYTITGESGRGASCIVYQGYYENSLGEKKTVYIKECYPFSLKMSRSSSGELSCEDEAAFDLYKKRFRESFSICNRIFETDGLTNTTSNYMDIHEKNGTLYTVITYRQGQELSLSGGKNQKLIINGATKINRESIGDDRTEKDRFLKELIRIIKSVAKTIGRIHESGYLYLDTKPDNIFVLDEMNESIQLFDFDSMIPINAQGDMGDYRLSYTKGFAPLEQRNGRLDLICEATDVYGVGALLFYMVFGRVPEALDCDPFATHDFSSARYDFAMYRDRLSMRMGAFFRKTLAVSIDDRYPDMSSVVEDLERLEADADLTGVFLYDSYYPVRTSLVGRDSETREITEFFDKSSGCLFIDGMGGIGKSALVRACLDAKREELDTVLYLFFEDSLVETVADDSKLTVNTLKKMPEEDIKDYFGRKLAAVKRAIKGQRVVLVIDNFEGEPGEAFAKIRDLDWQVVVISREDLEIEDEKTIHIGPVSEENRKGLFERYLGRELSSDETTDALKVTENIDGHTLATEIIAKQVKSGALSLERAVEITAYAGFGASLKGEVAFSRDGVHRHQALLGILHNIFKEDRLSEIDRSAIQTVSLFDQPGVHHEILSNLGGEDCLGGVTDMVRSGWITERGECYSVHPVIKEAIDSWEWSKQSVRDIRRIMCGLRSLPDVKGYQQSLIKNAITIDRIRRNKEYYALLWKWMSYDVREQEKLIRSVSALCEEACRYSEPVQMLQGMDFVCFVLEEMKEFDEAVDVLDVMSEYVYSTGDDYLIGLCEATRSQLFDSALNGAYGQQKGSDVGTYGESTERYAAKLREEMTSATDRAVSHMKKAVDSGYGRDSLLHLITYLLDHYVFIIRAYVGKEDPKRIYNALRRIRRMLDTAETVYLGGEYDTVLREKQGHFELAVGWYHTMVTRDADGVKRAIDRLHAIESPWKTELDRIDFDIVPCAEMLYRIDCKGESEEMLRSGVAICDKYEDVVPYRRKREELLEFIKDVREL